MPKATKISPQNHSAHVKVRVTPEERRTILAKAEAAGMELSHYVRTALLNAQVVAVPQDTALIWTQNRHLAQFGNNLNQLARHANGYPTIRADIRGKSSGHQYVARKSARRRSMLPCPYSTEEFS